MQPRSHGSQHWTSAFLEHLSSCPLAPPTQIFHILKFLPRLLIPSLFVLRKLNDLTSHLVNILIPPGDNYFVIVLTCHLILIILLNIPLGRGGQTMLWCIKKKPYILTLKPFESLFFTHIKSREGY